MWPGSRGPTAAASRITRSRAAARPRAPAGAPRERVVDLGPDDAEQRVMERLRVQIGHGAPSVWIAAAIHCRALLSASSLISSSQPFSSSSTPSTMPALISGM